MEAIAQLLQQSLAASTAKSAEQELRQYETQPGFPLEVLHVVASNQIDHNVRLAGSLFFKNLIRRKWTDEDGNYKLPINDVVTVKKEIIGLMIQLPYSLQVQLGEAVSIIADSDFPHRWPELLDDLVSQLSPEDMTRNKGVLTVAHSIFKRWRPLFRSDELFLEIKLVLEKFSVPFLTLLKQVDVLIQDNSNDKPTLQLLFEVLLLLIKIYYDLNCQEIPEFFEDNMQTGMGIMHKYLEFTSPVLSDTEADEVDIGIKVRTAICELIQLYTIRYEDVFGEMIPQFIQTIWNLLVSTGPQPKNDLFVSKSLAFLTAIAKIPKHVAIFESESALKEITERIILPNMTLREVDEELFEDDPIEYTRRDLEGSDSDTRRRAATDFLRELKEHNEALVTNSVMVYVTNFLSQFSSDHNNWRAKDTAVYLFSALAARGAITNSGVSATNMMLDVVQFFANNVAPDLVNPSVHPILKVDAIKYVYTFRNQLTKEQLVEAFPLLSAHFQSDDYVVFTYTAITIEKILSIRNSSDHHSLLFSKTDIPPEISKQLLMSLFNLMFKSSSTPEKLAENEFLMKCVMRVLLTAENSITDFAPEILSQLIQIVEVIMRNPSNPKFSHYTFESISVVVKFNSPVSSIKSIIETAVPQFLVVLGQDVQEFVPYVFQILAFLLETLPPSEGLPITYQQLVKPLLSPSVWEVKGNIPAVTRLLQAIIEQSPQTFNDAGAVTPVLGVFQKLIASKANDSYGIDLLQTIYFNMEPSLLSGFHTQVAMLLLQRLQNSRTEKFLKKLIIFLATISSLQVGNAAQVRNQSMLNAEFVTSFFDNVQEGIFGQILSNFILPSSMTFNNLLDRKLIITGLTNLAADVPLIHSGKYQDKCVPILENVIKLVTSDSITGYKSGNDNFMDELEMEDVAFGSSFNKLNILSLKPFDPVPELSKKEVMCEFVRQQLVKLNTNSGGNLNILVGQLSGEAKQGLAALGF